MEYSEWPEEPDWQRHLDNAEECVIGVKGPLEYDDTRRYKQEGPNTKRPETGALPAANPTNAAHVVDGISRVVQVDQ